MSKILWFTLIWSWMLGPVSVSYSAPDRVPGSRESFVFEPVFQSEVYVYEAGKGKAESVVLVHGVGDSGARVWDGLIPRLAEKYHVVTFDLPGFGRSSNENRLYSPILYAAFVKWVVDRYVNGPFVLIGHSLGGAVALRFASAYPVRLKRLILADVAGILHHLALTRYMAHVKIKDWWSGPPTSPRNLLEKLTGYTIDRLRRLPVDPGTVLGSAALRKRILGGSPSRIAGLALVNEDFSRLIGLVRVPTLILWGADDTVTPLRTGKLLAANMPDARLKIIPDAGHAAMLEKPNEFNRLISGALTMPLQRRSPPLKPMKSDRIGICRGKNGMLFTGAYKRIEVSDSRKVRLVKVTAESVKVSGSEVDIETSLIRGDDVALKVNGSVLTATAVKMEAGVAVSAAGSRLDLAGVELQGFNAALRTDGRSTLLFSVSHVKSPHWSGYVHGMREVSSDEPM